MAHTQTSPQSWDVNLSCLVAAAAIKVNDNLQTQKESISKAKWGRERRRLMVWSLVWAPSEYMAQNPY